MNVEKMPKANVPTMNRMIIAGMDASVHLRMNTTIDQNGIFMSVTVTSCFPLNACIAESSQGHLNLVAVEDLATELHHPVRIAEPLDDLRRPVMSKYRFWNQGADGYDVGLELDSPPPAVEHLYPGRM